MKKNFFFGIIALTALIMVGISGCDNDTTSGGGGSTPGSNTQGGIQSGGTFDVLTGTISGYRLSSRTWRAEVPDYNNFPAVVFENRLHYEGYQVTVCNYFPELGGGFGGSFTVSGNTVNVADYHTGVIISFNVSFSGTGENTKMTITGLPSRFSTGNRTYVIEATRYGNY